MAYGDGTHKHRKTPLGTAPACGTCQDRLTDVLDGTLSPAEQTAFDEHIDTCSLCLEQYAEAQRGIAWLEILKTPRPQPRAELLANILAVTSGTASVTFLPADVLAGTSGRAPGHLLAFRPQPSAPYWLGRLPLDPRLAMTAAMAFFSITLTMSLTGVQLRDLHASDLEPANLRHSVLDTEARAIRYYDNLRVVHVLQSSALDLRDGLQGVGENRRPVLQEPAQEPAKPRNLENSQPRTPAPRGRSFNTPPAVLPDGPRRSLVNVLAALQIPRRLKGGRA